MERLATSSLAVYQAANPFLALRALGWLGGPPLCALQASRCWLVGPALSAHILSITHNRFYTAALSLYVASTEAIAAFAVALALSAMGSRAAVTASAALNFLRTSPLISRL